jgi:succinyl-diaminopimelate desuccinylase
MSASPHERLLSWLDANRDRAVQFLQDFTRIDTSNPPGDTRAGAAFLAHALQAEGISVKTVAPQADKPNLVATIEGAGPGPHLVLNGHIDVFPAGDHALWSRHPFSGDLVDGQIHGRGTVDMKCGTSASVLTFLGLAQLREHWRGKLTLTAVSDEETGGRWGTGYLLEHMTDEVLGDCVLNGEPSSLQTVRYGEKAILGLRFTVKTPGAHGAYTHLSPSATKIAARLIQDLDQLEQLEPSIPARLRETLNRPEVRAAMDAGLGAGAADVAQRLTVNIGVVQGGVKVNMLPGECRIEADLRLPPGIAKGDVMREVRDILQAYPEVAMAFGESVTEQATWSDPDGTMLKLIQKHAAQVVGITPAPVLTLGGTDCRFWRARGVPAYVYGCSPAGMGVPNEAVKVDEYLAVLKVHALSAFDYLAGSEPEGD